MRLGRFEAAERVAPVLEGPHNICGVLIHATPGHGRALANRIGGLEGVEVHAVTDDDRIVVVVEDTAEFSALDRMRQFGELEGVAASSLVYHHFEDAEALEGEITE